MSAARPAALSARRTAVAATFPVALALACFLGDRHLRRRRQERAVARARRMAIRQAPDWGKPLNKHEYMHWRSLAARATTGSPNVREVKP